MTTINTADLTGAALDWAVWKAGGDDRPLEINEQGVPFIDEPDGEYDVTWWMPSRDWGQGGWLIQDGLLVVSPDPQCGWISRSYMDAKFYTGPTALIAAMRCYVASKMGDQVEVPDELKEEA